MKRFFALVLAILTLAAVLCACGESEPKVIQTTVASKYDDGYAAKYASSASTDSNGNKVYEFDDEQYEQYALNHKNTVSVAIQKELAANHEERFGEYAYINVEKQAVIIGIHEGEYDEKSAKPESATVAEYGFKYFQNLETPINAIKVMYVDAGDQDKIYGSFDYSLD